MHLPAQTAGGAGADNIAVYTPVFRTMDASGAIVLVAVFAVLVAVWCMAASWLGSHGG
jgi:cadmium resistance protein CadD (predicted permease)